MLQRKSNFELMRIISMIFIVLGHTLSWGGITDKTYGIVRLLIYFIYSIIVVHVNSYVLLTGYYQSKSKFRISKIVKLVCLMLFYRIFFYCLAIVCGCKQYFGFSDFIFNLLPLSNFSYWFLNVYIILYALSPFLNILICKINRKKYLFLLVMMFIFCSILPRITLEEFFDNSGGYSLVQFIYMYLIGAFFRKYPINFSIRMFGKKINLKNKTFLFLVMYLVLASVKYLLNYIGYRLTFYDGILNIIGSKMVYSFDCLIYDDPLVIFQSVFYFLFFYSLEIRSKLINILAKASNEVYLFHMNRSIRPSLYLFFGLNLGYYTIYSIPMALIISVCIFVMGFLIYYFRIFLLKMFLKLNWIKNIKVKIDEKFDNIDKIINV